ncbi:unnamed protein product [Linum trigynum]|uniref:Uncharacterized protein n=1 Tax=Linum trigynum TaxID=586398 RepID=A0AAV2E4Q5_9ROSI
MSVVFDDTAVVGRPSNVNQTPSPSLATVVLPEASESDVSLHVTNIVLKDTPEGALKRALQRGLNQCDSSRFENTNMDGRSSHERVEHEKLHSDVLSKEHHNGVRSEPLGGHDIPLHGRLKEKQFRGWQRSLPHPPCSRKIQTRVAKNTLQWRW